MTSLYTMRMKRFLVSLLCLSLALTRTLASAAQFIGRGPGSGKPVATQVAAVVSNFLLQIGDARQPLTPSSLGTAPLNPALSVKALSLLKTQAAAEATIGQAGPARLLSALILHPNLGVQEAIPLKELLGEPVYRDALQLAEAVRAAARTYAPAASALESLGAAAVLKRPQDLEAFSVALDAVFDGSAGQALTPDAIQVQELSLHGPTLAAHSPFARLNISDLAGPEARGLSELARESFAALPEDHYYAGLPKARRWRSGAEFTAFLDPAASGGLRLSRTDQGSHAWPALDSAMLESKGLLSLLRGLIERLPKKAARSGVKVSLKQVRLEGAASLRGVHQDENADFLAYWLVSRGNVSHSETRFYADAEGRILSAAQDLEPGELLLFDNKLLWHEAAAPAAYEPGKAMVRDVLAFQFSSLSPAVESKALAKALPEEAPRKGRAWKYAAAGLGLAAAAALAVGLSALWGATVMGTAIWIWVSFGALVAGLLALDIGVFHNKAKEVKPKEALIWTGIWVALAMLFAGGLGLWLGSAAALEFASAYLAEKALSVDNLFVILSLFSYFRVPPEYRHKVLFWGIVGAAGMRLGMILGGNALLHAFHWMTYAFGLILLWAAAKTAFSKEGESDPSKSRLYRMIRKVLPISDDYDADRFVTSVGAKRMFTPLILVLLMIEATDALFALDSIPVVFAITRNPFIALTSNIFAILGLRTLFFALSAFMDKFHRLKTGLSAILAFVALKMLLAQVLVIPVGLSLAVITGLLALSVAASLIWPQKKAAPPPAESAA